MERIRDDICKLRETTPLILQPMMVNIDIAGPLGNHRDTPTSSYVAASTWGKITNKQTPVMQDRKETFTTLKRLDTLELLNMHLILTLRVLT